MPDYQKGKVYKISCNITGLTYYGSTTQPLSVRMGGHKRMMNCSSKQIIMGGNYDYSLVEDCPCENKEQLHRRERFYIENNECVNKGIPGRTQKEYREQNRDKLLAQNKEYYEQNRDKISKQNKEYHEQNKDKISKQHRQYREQNKDKISTQRKEYREQNKDKIKEHYEQNKDKVLAQKKIKVTCECGSVVRKSDVATHCKTKKHRNYLESQK